MQSQTYSRLFLFIAVVILLLALGTMADTVWQGTSPALSAPPMQEEEAAAGSERTITVSGQGSVEARPDQALVRVGVETEAESAAAALDQNSQQLTGVISATLAAGVPEENLQTSRLQLQPIYQQPDEGDGPAQLVGYRASNILSITVDEPQESLGALLDAVVEAGGNRIEGISFRVSDNERLRAAAREAAMEDAIATAEQLAALAGAEIGEVLTIRQFGGAAPSPVAFETEQAAAGRAVPIQAGQQTIDASVEVVWRLR